MSELNVTFMNSFSKKNKKRKTDEFSTEFFRGKKKNKAKEKSLSSALFFLVE